MIEEAGEAEGAGGAEGAEGAEEAEEAEGAEGAEGAEKAEEQGEKSLFFREKISPCLLVSLSPCLPTFPTFPTYQGNSVPSHEKNCPLSSSVSLSITASNWATVRSTENNFSGGTFF